ncbi:MAG: DNA polymerase, partial [bacterium]|nr:DNA polymerase [bacterium]
MPARKKRERLVLLDTHAIIHRAYHAIPELSSPKGEPVGAVYGLSAMFMRIAKELKPDHIIAAYDLPGPTHRHEIYKEYKAKRPKADDALIEQITRSRDILSAFGIPIYEAPGFEADDVIGTIAVSIKKDFDVIIASGDMDTLQLVDDERVRVFTLRRGIQDTILYDEKGVIERYGFPPTRIPDFKGFAGDPSDNIIGIPGIGEKTATNLLITFGSMKGVYAALKKSPKRFSDAGLSPRIVELLKNHEDEAEFSKVLATIRIDAPIAFVEPKETFEERLDIPRITELFTELGFRSLVPRLKSLKLEAESEKEGDGTQKSSLALQFSGPLSEKERALLKEAAVMLWLTNSDITNPSLEDVLNNTKSKTLEEAHKKLSETVKKEDLTKVFEEIEKPLIPVIEAINAHGVLIDASYLKDLSREYHTELEALAKKIYTAAGEEFNINSPKQLGDVLFGKLGIGAAGVRRKKTATGQLSTKESELAKLKGAHPIIEEILSFRELQKLLSTYIDAIPPLLDSKKRLHTSFIQTGTTTGRLSSQNPNLQNIPIKSELGRRIRRGFVTPVGSLLVAFDYSQIELRLAAILSGDEKLSEIFKRGEDIHAAVAAEVFGVLEKEVTYEMRRRAKVINFGILYGMGVNALRESLGTDRAAAQEFYNRYFETFSGLAAYLSKTKASAARLGYTTTLFGRKRFFPGIRSKLPYVRAMAERMAINAPLQGTQSDIVKIAMARVHKLLEEKFNG